MWFVIFSKRKEEFVVDTQRYAFTDLLSSSSLFDRQIGLVSELFHSLPQVVCLYLYEFRVDFSALFLSI